MEPPALSTFRTHLDAFLSPALRDPVLAGGLGWVISTGPFQFRLFCDAAHRTLECKTWAVRKPIYTVQGCAAGQAENGKGRSNAQGSGNAGTKRGAEAIQPRRRHMQAERSSSCPRLRGAVERGGLTISRPFRWLP